MQFLLDGHHHSGEGREDSCERIDCGDLIDTAMDKEYHSYRSFSISNDMFMKDGKPYQIIGGDLHYFRIVPQYWEDRLLRAKALGLNVIQTYVPWNLHEPKPGMWNFDGIANLEAFLKLADNLDFLVMIRVGPYICAEWDLGGLPPWLLALEPAIKLRSSEMEFLKLVERWWNILFAKIVPFLYNNGGPIIMVQIENEYGSFGSDKSYLHFLAKTARSQLGSEVILYTTDGGAIGNLDNGTIMNDGVYAAVDFSTGDDPWQIFSLQKKYNAPGMSPALTAEFYTGWLTHWGERFAETNPMLVASELDKILARNGSAVLYMAHGGTNFGFFSGANSDGISDFKPDITSYDYDAPIRENGDISNSKFKALQHVILKYNPMPASDIPSIIAKRYGTVSLEKLTSIFDGLGILSTNPEGFYSEKPLTMESLQQNAGFMLYESRIFLKNYSGSRLSIPMIHDRAQVFLISLSQRKVKGPSYIGTFQRWSNSELVMPKTKSQQSYRLLILVENMGHINYGRFIYDTKGILSPVLLDGVAIYGWKMYPIPLTNLTELKKLIADRSQEIRESEIKLSLKSHHANSMKNSILPTFYGGSFNIVAREGVKDTYISLQGWTKGVAFINSFNLGRFWMPKGPQCNLYIPAPLLHDGQNDLIIFELENPNPKLEVNLVEAPDFTCGQGLMKLKNRKKSYITKKEKSFFL